MEQPFKQLHSLRKSRKLKQEDVAKMAGISREAYLRAESGRADPRLSTLMAVAGALGLEVVLAPREAVAEIERVIASHPTQPLSGSTGSSDVSQAGSMGGSTGGHGLAGQYRGPERHPQSAYHPSASSHSQAGQQGAPHAGNTEDRSRTATSDRPAAGGTSGGGSDRPGSGSGSRES
ncbi:helix-turn-helix domain-containing protein [Ralstonia sp. R-29]|uniref:helix-turn-helix domain-containing protein n=1 Tax=Ralstonia sp. R-29 TaxID=3404059 RepID=UPI003CF3C6A4